MCIKTNAQTIHPAHERAILALTDAVEACREFSEDHDGCADEDCGCQVAGGLVAALEMFLAFLEGAASSPVPERPFNRKGRARAWDGKATRRESPYPAACCR